MVKVFAVAKPLLNLQMKCYGMTSQIIEIEPGTKIKMLVPTALTKNNPKVTSKPAVMFLQGFATDGTFSWLSQVTAFASEYSVFVPDLLFFGGSMTDKPDRSLEFQAECLVKALRKFGVEKCSVVGLSYGATVGFKMAKLYPDLVDCVVASGTVVDLTESTSEACLKRMGYSSWSEFLMPESVKDLKAFLAMTNHKPPSMPDFVAKDFIKEFMVNRKERTELLQAWVVSDNEAVPCNYSQKIHLLWGEDDKVFNSEIAENIKQKLGGEATLEFVKEAGHLVQSDQATEYNNRVKKILSSLQKA
ncbi:hypothetical protein DCAR_0103885 [Daucus carota subsp. sativus]|uniref:Uncharacterized protein n=1 Tax=Daucus carota subsp. sativus TaxID=79200 RepID=A0A166IDD0_DAUCS|nr:PREDICTED: epoxide hydrolase 4-like [Daucus carota subsp. sativus]WOG84701.1 hypothetical protein DCAR_0103885 [Daucus carota subsp. sativus]